MIHIVDDDALLIRVLADLAEGFCYKTRQFTTPQAYLDFAASAGYTPPKAVFADVMMPDMDGFELMHRVHAMHPDVRFIIMSGKGHSIPEDRREACVYLVKPFRFAKLEKTFCHLRTCRECGPTDALVNAWPDDRERYDSIPYTCPFTDEDDA